jgi:hypothetical protein
MHYSRSIEVMGSEKEDGGFLLTDLYKHDGSASVAATMGYGFAYGKGKCSVTVSLKCDQSAEVIDRAASLAMYKADELAQEGMQIAERYLRQAGAWEG